MRQGGCMVQIGESYEGNNTRQDLLKEVSQDLPVGFSSSAPTDTVMAGPCKKSPLSVHR